MSVRAVGPGYVAQAQTLRYGEDDRGYGWVLFAGLMLGMAGTINFIKSWGWVVLILGVLQGLASLGIFVLAIFTIDVLIVHGLVTYGGRVLRPA